MGVTDSVCGRIKNPDRLRMWMLMGGEGDFAGRNPSALVSVGHGGSRSVQEPCGRKFGDDQLVTSVLRKTLPGRHITARELTAKRCGCRDFGPPLPSLGPARGWMGAPELWGLGTGVPIGWRTVTSISTGSSPAEGEGGGWPDAPHPQSQAMACVIMGWSQKKNPEEATC